MSNTQRIIKYLATAFGIFLVVTIILGIINVVFSLGNIFDDSNTNLSDLKDININENVSVLDIDVKSVRIKIKKGELLVAKTNNKNINVRQEKNKLFITQKKFNLFNNNDDNELVIYVPENLVFDGVSINTGAGSVEIEKLETKTLYLELGAGKAEIDNLVVLNQTEIDGGAGEVTIKNGELNNLDLDMGVGKLSLTAYLNGDNEIDSGVGEINLNLIGSLADYKITLDKGIGAATLDGENMKDNGTYGLGRNLIDIDGGIGALKINFQ